MLKIQAEGTKMGLNNVRNWTQRGWRCEL